MNLQQEIEQVFAGKAFARPLFYRYPGGLRFALSEGGAPLTQVLKAMDKARAICADIFANEGELVCCLRQFAGESKFAHRHTLRQLRIAGIRIPPPRTLWLTREEEEGDEAWLHLAFALPVSVLPNLLWCAVTADFAALQPQPQCAVYLFNLAQQVMVLPYDDRGMDVVGPNHAFLAQLYRLHQRYLLEYDRATMAASFEE